MNVVTLVSFNSFHSRNNAKEVQTSTARFRIIGSIGILSHRHLWKIDSKWKFNIRGGKEALKVRKVPIERRWLLKISQRESAFLACWSLPLQVLIGSQRLLRKFIFKTLVLSLNETFPSHLDFLLIAS